MDLDVLQTRSTSPSNASHPGAKAGGGGFSGIMELMTRMLASDTRATEYTRAPESNPVEQSESDRAESPAPADPTHPVDEHDNETQHEVATAPENPSETPPKHAVEARTTESERVEQTVSMPTDAREPSKAMAADASPVETSPIKEMSSDHAKAAGTTGIDTASAKIAETPAVPGSTAEPSPVGKPTDAPTTQPGVTAGTVASAAVSNNHGAGTPVEPVAATTPESGIKAPTGVPAPAATAPIGHAPAEPAVAALQARAAAPVVEPSAGTTNKPAITVAVATPAPVATLGTATRPEILSGKAPQAEVAPLANKPAVENPTQVLRAQGPTPGNGDGGALPASVKVTVEQPTVVARSHGVSSAVLVQAQQAAASSGEPARAPLHVGGTQSLHVGADGNASNQVTANQPNGGQTNNGQPNANGGGQMGQAANFGLTIGQRGFGGEAARTQFQDILATRTARPVAASTLTTTPVANASTAATSSLLMAGSGGPQSTHTASSILQAGSPATGRPGALAGTAVDQVAVKLASSAKDGGGRIQIKLNPEELGKVDVKLEIGRDGLVKATVSAERTETLELLQRDAKALEKALQEAGLKTDRDSLEFDLRGRDGSDGRNGGRDVANDDGQSGSTGGDDETAADAADNGTSDPDGLTADGSLNLVA